MTEEIKTATEEKECKCFCKNEAFRKILVIATGTFVGVFCALSLFAALHRPPMMPPCRAFGPMGPCPQQVMQYKHHPHFDKGPRGDFGKRDFKPQKDFGRQAPFEAQKAPRPEINN